ncbi:MAG: restriction endonuclease subunit S [Gemmatimonadales bacterium]
MIDGLKPYAVYKDSGVPWLGQVPEDWALRRMKTVLRERRQKGFPDEPLLAATQTKGVVRKEDYENRTVLALKDLHLLKLVRVGDFVISLRSFQGGIEYAREQGIISPAYTVLYPSDPNTHAYLAWLFKSRPYIENLTLFVTGIRQGQSVDYEKLSRSELPVPPAPDRSAIVTFLNNAERCISRHIRTKEKLVKLLEEQKRAIIDRVVTRGLDSNVRLKPSGVEWLGDVPEHWEVSRVKAQFACLNRRRIPLSGTARGALTVRQFDYYGASGVIDKVDSFLFDDDLLLIAEDGANLVLRNLPLAIVARGRFWVNNHAHVLKPKRGNIEFLAAIMEGLNYMPWISGAAQPKLTQDRLMSIAIAVPPRDEQDRIIERVRGETTPLRIAIDRCHREVSLLQEYRTRLITDVVVGRLDVREAAKALPEPVVEDEPLEESQYEVGEDGSDGSEEMGEGEAAT